MRRNSVKGAATEKYQQRNFMKAIFLSDAHLKRSSDPGYGALMSFLGRLKGPDIERGVVPAASSRGEVLSITITDLFLVGDIFDIWFSKGRRIYPEYERIVGRLGALKQSGVDIHFCEGNHDFFLKDYFSDVMGMHVYEDWAIIHRDGRKFLIGHGDLVDQTNRQYLRLRKIMRSGVIYHLQRLLPLSLLWGMAWRSSSMSKELMAGAEEQIYEKMRQFADDRFKEGFDAVILGHCHKAWLAERTIDGRRKIFATLGDWIRHDSYLHYVGGEFILAKK